MSDALLLSLASTASVAKWLLVDTAGSRMGIVMSGDLADAAVMAAGRKVIVLVPGTDVHLANPTLPVKRGAQLEQVMRYALEENIANDIDDMHFTMGKRQTDGSTPVVVVEHRHMAAWLDALNTAGIVADALYAESDVLPNVPGGICIVIDGSLLYVRHGDRSTTLDVQPLSEALQLVLASEATLVGDVLIYVPQSEYEAHAPTLDALRARIPNVQVKLLPEGPLPLLAPQAVQANAINLLTGKYARKKSWNKTLAPWRIAAMLAGVMVLLHLSTSGLQLWQLSRTEKQLDQQIREVVTQTLPGVQIADTRKARQLFAAPLNALQTDGGDVGLLSSLNVLKVTMEQVTDVRVDALAYRPKVIDLRVTAPTVDALARIQQLVNEQGLHADLQSATPRDNKVEGRLQVKSPGA
jgi:general secretion pathway protein L